MDVAREWALAVWGIVSSFEPGDWSAILLAILVVQGWLIVRRVTNRSDQLLRREFAEVNTRLNMVIFELRQIRGAYGPQGEQYDQQMAEDEQYSAAAE